jgi:hypothetical protein
MSVDAGLRVVLSRNNGLIVPILGTDSPDIEDYWCF